MIRAEPRDRPAGPVRCATGTVPPLADGQAGLEAWLGPAPPLAAEHPVSAIANATTAAGQHGLDFIILIPFDQGSANA
jgi:hypothetical protein